MVVWMARMFQNNRIKFPKKSNKDIDELKRQISIFSEIITEAGGVSYRAEGKEHDDTVMALMLACFIGRNFIKNIDGLHQDMQIVNKKFTDQDDNIFGTGVPSYTTPTSVQVMFPK